MRLLIWILQALPLRGAVALMRGLAWIGWALGVRRRITLDNLALAFPELSAAERRRMARRNYLHLGTCGAEVLRDPGPEELAARVDATEWEKIEPWLRGEKGVIVATAHLGNFELFGVYGKHRGVPLNVVTRELKGSANAQWVARRLMAGIKEIHRGMHNLFDAVQRGEVLALLIDQNMLPKRAVFAPFFGRLAATTPAPAVVAERTGAPVFIGLMPRNPDGTYRVVIEGPFVFERRSPDRQQDVLDFTAMLNERLERHVRAWPDQWFWMHRRWKTRPPEETDAPASEPQAQLTTMSNSR